MKRIAVLMSAYRNDRLEYLRQSVESILGQTYEDVMLMVGVDGPVDDRMRSYLSSLERDGQTLVRWFEENRGLACVLNDLIEECRKNGIEYYGRMDADDIAVPDRLEKQLQYLEAHPEVDVVGGAIEEIDEAGLLLGKTVCYPLSDAECRRYFRYRDPVAHPSVLFRARFFEKVKDGYRKEYRRNQDTMLWFDGFKSGCVFANLPDTVLRYRVTENYYIDRLGDWSLAMKKLKDRMMINRELHFGLTAYLFAFALYSTTALPKWLKRFLHKRR